MRRDLADQIEFYKMEYDYRHPKMRMTILTFLVESGAFKFEVTDSGDIIETLDEIMAWICEGADELYSERLEEVGANTNTEVTLFDSNTNNRIEGYL